MSDQGVSANKVRLSNIVLFSGEGELQLRHQPTSQITQEIFLEKIDLPWAISNDFLRDF